MMRLSSHLSLVRELLLKISVLVLIPLVKVTTVKIMIMICSLSPMLILNWVERHVEYSLEDFLTGTEVPGNVVGF